ncbi:MAG: thiamine-phosphate kinase [Myxococcota bacterium]
MPSELQLIDLFTRAFPRVPPPRGPGDDCAVLPPVRGELCVTTDALVEGVHFTRRTFSLEDVGYKALAVNLSDLAAMGATPRWFVCALGLPRGFSASEVRRLAAGMAKLARAQRVDLVGGNFTSSPVLSLTLTVAGEVPKGRALTRAGAKAQDFLYCSGTLGEARAGLTLPFFSLRQRRPSPRLSLGRLARAYAHAAIDVSDGFTQDLGHLCDASRVGALVQVDRLPLRRALVRAVGEEAARHEALAGGEDYELLLAVPPFRARAFERACAKKGLPVTRVGRLTRRQGLRLVDPKGKRIAAPKGFDHFRRFDAHESRA